MTDLTVQLSEKLKNTKIKNESFNTLMSRERESVTWEVRGKPFGREKTWVNKGNGHCSLLFSIM